MVNYAVLWLRGFEEAESDAFVAEACLRTSFSMYPQLLFVLFEFVFRGSRWTFRWTFGCSTCFNVSRKYGKLPCFLVSRA